MTLQYLSPAAACRLPPPAACPLPPAAACRLLPSWAQAIDCAPVLWQMVRGAYSEDRAADVLRQLGSALAFLHENSIVHR